jgi:hypothetical protein
MLLFWIQFLPKMNESDGEDYLYEEMIATGIVPLETER